MNYFPKKFEAQQKRAWVELQTWQENYAYVLRKTQ